MSDAKTEEPFQDEEEDWRRYTTMNGWGHFVAEICERGEVRMASPLLNRERGAYSAGPGSDPTINQTAVTLARGEIVGVIPIKSIFRVNSCLL